MNDIKGDPLDLLLRIQHAQSGEDYGTGMFSRPRGVGFAVGSDRLILPLNDIREILTVEELSPVPLVQPWVLGMTNIRGNVVTVVDLPGYLGMPIRPRRDAMHLILLNARGFQTAIRVTRLLGLRQLAEGDFDRSRPVAFSAAVLPLVGEQIFTEDASDTKAWGRLELKALVSREDFIEVARPEARAA